MQQKIQVSSGGGGIRTPLDFQGKTTVSQSGGAESGAPTIDGVGDVLAELIALWPTLGSATQETILAMARVVAGQRGRKADSFTR